MGLRTSLVAVALASLLSAPAFGADLGGNCCADLEDRIAELEATTARKGNRKIHVKVYGVVNEAIMHIGGDHVNGNWTVGQNSNVESFIGVAGEAVITPDIKAGYVLELGIGNNRDDAMFGSPFAHDGTGTYTRRSFGYVEHKNLGRVSVGLTNQATDGIAEISVANTQVAARMLSLKPIVGPNLGDVFDIFDGTRTNAVRYDTPAFYGARVSASWSSGGIEGMTTGDVWDVALRWAGESNGFQAAAGLGYRQGIAVPGYGGLGSMSVGGTQVIDPQVFSGSASIKHTASGLFLNGSAGTFDIGGTLGNHVNNFTAWTIQGGLERQLFPVGKTTLFAEYADSTTLKTGNQSLFGLSYWGLGGVQSLDAAATDMYVSYRRYDAEFFGHGGEADLFMAGVKVEF